MGSQVDKATNTYLFLSKCKCKHPKENIYIYIYIYRIDDSVFTAVFAAKTTSSAAN